MLQVGTSRRWAWPIFSNRRANLWWGVPTPPKQVNEPAPESQSKGASHLPLTTRKRRVLPGTPARPALYVGMRQVPGNLAGSFAGSSSLTGSVFLVFPFREIILEAQRTSAQLSTKLPSNVEKSVVGAHPGVRPPRGGHTGPPLHQNKIRASERRPAGNPGAPPP